MLIFYLYNFGHQNFKQLSVSNINETRGKLVGHAIIKYLVTNKER